MLRCRNDVVLFRNTLDVACMIDIRTLEAFYWVAQLGGFGRAATKLNTTQPAISARIATLEAEYGVRLLVRERGLRPALTPVGAALFDQARRMLALQADVVSTLSEQGGMRGLIRIGVAETIVHILLPELLRRLHVEHPGVTPNVQTDVSVNLREALRGGEIDLAFMLGPSGEISAQERPICSLDLAWAASPRLEIGDTALTRASIGTTPILTYAHNTQPYAELVAALADPHLPVARIFPNSSLATIVSLAQHGIGIAAIPAVVIRSEIESGTLRLLPSTIQLSKLNFLACWLSPGEGLPGAIAALARDILGHNQS